MTHTETQHHNAANAAQPVTTQGAGRGDARREALLLLSAMAGAVVMSRAAAGSPVSEEVLDAVRELLLARYPREPDGVTRMRTAARAE